MIPIPLYGDATNYSIVVNACLRRKRNPRELFQDTGGPIRQPMCPGIYILAPDNTLGECEETVELLDRLIQPRWAEYRARFQQFRARIRQFIRQAFREEDS